MIEDQFAFHFGTYYGTHDEVRAVRSARWVAKRVKNVVGLGMAVPKKDKDGDEVGDAPEESRMMSGERVDPHLMRLWKK